jgi:hypothetical protein
MVRLFVLALLIGGALTAPTASASPKVLTLKEGAELQPLAPGSEFSLYTYSPVLLQTSAGYVECPYETQMISGILRATDLTDEAKTDEATVYGALGRLATKSPCISSIAALKGPVYLKSEAFPWTLKLRTNGKASLEGSPRVVFEIYNGEAGVQCYFERKTLNGIFGESLEVEFSGKLELNRASSLASCPRSAELTLPFQEASTTEGREGSHRLYAVVE